MNCSVYGLIFETIRRDAESISHAGIFQMLAKVCTNNDEICELVTGIMHLWHIS